MSKIDYQALRGAAEAIKIAATPQKLLAFRMKATPQVVLELLDEREAQSKRIAELEANFATLAVENVGLNKFIKDDCFIYTSDDISPRDANGFKPETPATDAFLADIQAVAFNELRAAFVRHAKIAGLGDGDTVTLKEATDALLHCAEQLRAPEGLVILAECPQ
ncbi:ead/Ea22-like family protein [Escherichia coli]|uniref:ead/Ea22-like family protein n=1 Tax=Escherichia coli TaxID=562 RepID=UPI0021C94E41|nr:ead/Ea22-like family protein [Escherichia coli]MCU0009873.1 ead/Ea22-like family protein [Escherichia coli]